MDKDGHSFFQRLAASLRLCGLIFLCIFTAENSSAQNNFDSLAEKIRRGNTEQKRDALFEIRNLETAAAARLAIPALTDKAEIVRASTAFSVVYLPKDESLAVLLPLLKDKKELVRREAARAIGKTRNPAAVKILVQTLQTDKIGDVKNASIIALGDIGDASAIDALTNILQRKSKADEEFARRSAARSIGQIAQIIQTGETQVLTPEDFLPDEYKRAEKARYANLIEAFPVFRAAQNALIQILQTAGEAADVKRETAFALGAIGDAAAISVLRVNLNADDYYLARICKEALRKITVRSNTKDAE